ncbi:Spermatogenesis-associated protein 7 [Liparis tanakae]|uniref:Spermatogenesis-associated protein 7 n=1 Tax=Liparis tanakae TaxID=230148 RepID=A0A4Z2FBZ0_9TELE|nr:Spermatogenesis-associated protein 7 [Liparis tanakae]
MVSHYKRVYSATAAIDASVPRSLMHSVKYNDQRCRRAGRPQPALSLSQTDSRASCSSSQSRLSVEYADGPDHGARSSTVSSPRFISSFHAKEIVYPSFRVGSQNHSHHIRPASEIPPPSPEAAPRRQQAARSPGAAGEQRYYKTFQDPAQQTYSGDLLQRHAQHFTTDRAFTPKTLKSETSSYLSQYRYYRAPRRNAAPQSGAARATPQQTHRGRDVLPSGRKRSSMTRISQHLGNRVKHTRAEKGIFTTPPGRKLRMPSGFDNAVDAAVDRVKSRLHASCLVNREEELMYLEFISAVTEDILSRAYISDRLLDRLIKRHVDMNRHHLDVGKMRHLLEGLRKDFEEPTNRTTSRTEPGGKLNARHDSFQMHLGSGGEGVRTEQDSLRFPYASEITPGNTPDYADPLLASPPVCSPEPAALSPVNASEEGGGAAGRGAGAGSPRLGEHVSDEDPQAQIVPPETSTEVSNENHEDQTIAREEGFHQDGAAVGDDETREVEDLGRSVSASLHVSGSARRGEAEAASRPRPDTVAPVSDDEF